MTLLQYKALRSDGVREAGLLEAPTAEAAMSALRSRGLVVLDVSDVRAGRRIKVRTSDLAEFTRALAALLPAGMPLTRAIAVSRDIAPSSMTAALAEVQAQVERGSTFADALAAQPSVFPASYTGLVRAGERAGNLAESIGRLADAIESEEQFRSKLLTAAIYPMLLAIVGSAAILVLLLVVLPRFGALFSASGSELPASTALVLAISSALRAHALLVLVLAATVVILGAWIAISGEAAEVRSSMLLWLPGVSQLYRNVLAARVSRVMAILLAGGATLVAALDDASRSLGDPSAQREMLRWRARIREGASPTAVAAEGTLFPPVLARLIAAGDESGQLDSFFAKAADLFEERAKRSAARFLSLAEPALIVVFGVIVGLIALALVQAIYGVNLAPMRGAR